MWVGEGVEVESDLSLATGTYQNLLALPQEEINKYTQLAG